MRIGIDARLLERGTTGIGRYLANFVRNIPECDLQNEYILFSYRSVSEFAGRNVKSVPTVSHMPQSRLFQKFISPFWLNIILPVFLKREQIDIFFSPNALIPFGMGKIKHIAVIHDLFYCVDKRFHSAIFRIYESILIPRAAKRSDMILTNSEASKRDIIKYLNIAENKIRVIYHATEDRFKPRELSRRERDDYLKKYDLPEKYILYVGVIETRKNIAGIIQTADILALKTNVPVVLIGRPGHGGRELIKKIKKRKNMRYLGFVDDGDIPYLYNLASVFFFPSFYEGFGLPPLEAMNSGIPVVASNTSSLPEVVGSGGILLEPDNMQGFASAITDLLDNSVKRDDLVQRGILQSKKFSYRKMTEETIRAFFSLI